MDVPHVRNIYEDTRHGVTYRVVAYRTLSRVEMLSAVREYLAHRNGRMPRAGQEITIVTLLGRND
jgi:hypothetical protein